jgi:UDP-N-acetyl-2-amino-2-deoxyglucuronate dehydrogenase
MKKLRIGLLGCGRISVNHIQAIKQLSEYYDLIAVCDEVSSRAEEAAIQTGATPYSSYEQMLENEDLDIITLCTPSGLHPEHGILASAKGLHVITEKPMATSLKSADTLIQACEQNGVKLFVVKQNRLNSTLQLVKKAVDNNRFGKIYLATVNVFWQRPQSYYDAASWRGTWALDGGAFMNQASHYVDMLEWLVGDVASVFALTDTNARNIEAEDTGSAVMRFKNGAIGNMNVTMLTYPKNLEGSLTLLGEKGTVVVGGTSVNTIETWEFADKEIEDSQIEEANYTPPSVYGFGHFGYYTNVAEVLLDGASPLTDGREGRKSLELIEAIYRSARERREIILPL